MDNWEINKERNSKLCKNSDKFDRIKEQRRGDDPDEKPGECNGESSMPQYRLNMICSYILFDTMSTL